MVTPSIIDEFYRERIEDNMAQIRYLSIDVGEMNRLRELFPDDWKIEELVRFIIFEEAQIIDALRKEIERDQRAIREIKKGRAV